MSDSINFNEWLSLKSASDRSGYTVGYIRKLIRAEKLEIMRQGRMLFVSVASLDTYVAKMKSLGSDKHNWRRLHD